MAPLDPTPVGDDGDPVAAHTDWLAGRGGSLTSRASRRLSERVSRRGMLARIGRWAVGVSGVTAVNALPVARTARDAAAAPGAPAAPQPVAAPSGAGRPAQAPETDTPLVSPFEGTDPTECDYWRYCNFDGALCSTCAGGGVTTCPPGTTPGAEFWVGCCNDPETGSTYLIAYYDCCGAAPCSNDYCQEVYSQMSPYDPATGSQDTTIVWCLTDETQAYACTIAPIMGQECSPRPSPKPARG
jgi:methylamine dehydrogenase light chain